MSSLERKLQEDRATRDAARRLIEADLAFVRGDNEERGLAKRAADSVGDTSQTLAGRTLDYAKAHPLAVSGGLAAILLFLFRNPILDLVLGMLDDDEDDEGAPHEPLPGSAGDDPDAARSEPAASEDCSKRKWFHRSGEVE